MGTVLAVVPDDRCQDGSFASVSHLDSYFQYREGLIDRSTATFLRETYADSNLADSDLSIK